MEAGIALREGILEPELYPRLLEYFNKQQLNSAYLERQWRQWGKNKGLFHYTAVRGERELAWIVYNPASSTIEEFLLNPDEEGVNLESILDALLIRKIWCLPSFCKKIGASTSYWWNTDFGPAGSIWKVVSK